MTNTAMTPEISLSPGRRVWRRFRQNRRGYWSLVIFAVLFVLSLGAELISNDRPLVARYNGQLMFPIVTDYAETAFGGEFDSPADYLDPFIQSQFDKPGNWASIRSIAIDSIRSTILRRHPIQRRPRVTTG
jgi:microcin C transport system permease protein